MNHPPLPPETAHFAFHDYKGDVGTVPIFWCSEPYWSHDEIVAVNLYANAYGEPWRLDCPLHSMQRFTIAAVAEAEFRKAIAKLYENYRVSGGEWPEYQAQEYREAIESWREWAK